MEYEIKSERLLLRPVRPEDDAAITVAANDWEVAKWLSRMPHPYRLDDARSFLARNVGTGSHLRAVLHKDQFLGLIEAKEQFGYWYGRHSWGQGVATEAGRAFLAEYFSTPRDDLTSGFLIGNARSENVLLKLGFKESGTRIVDTPMRGAVMHQDMSLSQSDWLAGEGLPIATQRLVLRPLAPADIPDLKRIAGNDAIARNLCSVKAPWDDSDIAAWIHASRFRAKVGFRLGVTLKTGELIGMIGLGGDCQPSVSYFISAAHQGKGFASEALQAMLSYGFTHFDLSMITADVFTDNPASARVLERNGFECCGKEMATSVQRVEPAPVFLYRLTADRHKAA